MKFRRKWKLGGHPRRSSRPYHRYRKKRLLNKPCIGYEAEEECIYGKRSVLRSANSCQHRRSAACKGIAGSDAAAVLGISPFRTGRDLYYDKLNIVTADDNENWVQLEVGTLLEPLVAKIFAHKTGYKIYRRPFMFQHPLYPWMLADLDYMVELPDGTTAILEIKTTNYNAKDNWWYNGEEIVPIYYESQGRHYMAVMNIDRVYFCCLYGNSEDEAMIRRIDRDMAYEEELIALERDFWENHVLTKTPPPYVEADGDLILESLRRKLGPADKDAPPVLLGQTQFGQLSMLLSLQEQKKALSADVSKLDKDIKRLKGMLIERMGTSCTAVYNGSAESYTITYNPVRSAGISKDALERLKDEHPDIYDQYVTVSEWRRFHVKKAALQAA